MVTFFEIFLGRFYIFFSLFKPQAHFLNGSFDFSVLYILWTLTLSDVELAKILSYSLGFFFTKLIISLSAQELFISVKSHLSIVGLKSWSNGVLFRKSSPTPVSCRALPVFSSNSFWVSGFRFRPLIHKELVSVQSGRFKSNFILLHVDIQFSRHCLLKMSFLQLMFFHLCGLQITTVTCTQAWVFSIVLEL